MQRQQHEVGSDADALGDSGNRRRDRQNRWRVAVLGKVMLSQPDLVVPEVFSQARLRELIGIELGEGLAPRRRVPKWEEQPNIQIATDTHRPASRRISCS